MTKSGSAARLYRGRTKEQLSEERRERLLEAAVELFAAEGYANVSIERLCTTARVANRYFYEHFPSREALLATLFDEFIGEALSLTVEALLKPGNEQPVDRAIEALRSFSRFCMANPERARIALVETVGVSRELEQRRREVIGSFADVIAGAADQLAENGVLPPANHRLAGVALVGATNELLIEWLSGETGLNAEQMERQVVTLFEAIIRGAQLQAEERGKAGVTS